MLIGLVACACHRKPTSSPTQTNLIQRGKYLVTVIGCGDCHSPKIMTPAGPIEDTTRLLSGHPAGEPFPPFDTQAVMKGVYGVDASDFTAYAGPWGISFAANLTPDSATGIGTWTDSLFIRVIRSGKYYGTQNGRPLLPPMPWQDFKNLTDEDLKAIFAYLKSLPPVHNPVPAPIPPGH